MSEMINKSDLMTAVCDHCDLHGECEAKHCELTDVINGLETVETEPVRHGYWISDNKDFLHHKKLIKLGDAVPVINNSPICSCHCSVCGEWLVASDEYYVCGCYCPHCGAKMDGDTSCN